MSEEVKTCVSCKHFDGPPNFYVQQMQIQVRGQDEPLCKNPRAETRDPIYGRTLCRNERNSKKGCGKQGKLWESQQSERKD